MPVLVITVHVFIFIVFASIEGGGAIAGICNKFENLMAFLIANGIRGLVGKNDWPRYTEEEPEMYEKEELGKLFAACDAEERLWYEFFLMTGMSCYSSGGYFVRLRTSDRDHALYLRTARVSDAQLSVGDGATRPLM